MFLGIPCLMHDRLQNYHAVCQVDCLMLPACRRRRHGMQRLPRHTCHHRHQAQHKKSLATSFQWASYFTELCWIFVRVEGIGPLNVYDGALWPLWLVWLASRGSVVDWDRFAASWSCPRPSML
eukprot:995172-Pyramimonas_sp.AAC.1